MDTTLARRLLLPYDGRPASHSAMLHVALSHAEAFPRAEVVVLNVQRVIIDAELLHEGRRIRRFHRLEGAALLQPALNALAGAGIRCRGEVMFGSPARAIVEAAGRFGCDLIVIGARPRRRVLDWLGRSVSARVERHATVPVLRIPPPAPGPLPPTPVLEGARP